MKVQLPQPLAEYLRTIESPSRPLAFLKIGPDKRVKDSGGMLELFRLDTINSTHSIESQLEILQGLLPADHNPTVIENTQTVPDRFLDLHIFVDAGFDWVVFLDNTAAGIKLQQQQQKHLEERQQNVAKIRKETIS